MRGRDLRHCSTPTPMQAEYEDLQARAQRQTAPDWKGQYHRRAGIEGTLSQGIRALELLRTRYIGLAKTRLQHVLTAAATMKFL